MEFWSFVGVIAGVYAISALGLQLQVGYAGLVNFGHAAFMGVGAYAMAILVVDLHLPLWLSCVAGVAAAGVLGLAIGVPGVRLKSHYFAITTLAVAEILRLIAVNERGLTGGAEGTIALGTPGSAALFNSEWLTFQGAVGDVLEGAVGSPVSDDVVMLVIVWLTAVALFVVVQGAVRSPWGRVLRAIREDEDAAAVCRKNVNRFKLQALVLGGAIAGISGLLFAFELSFFSPAEFAPLTTFYIFLIVLVGGVGRVWAIPVGALVFGFLFAGTRFFEFFPFTLLGAPERAYVRSILIGVVLIAIVVFRPQGLLGKREELAMR